MNDIRKEVFRKAKRIVIKIGSNVLTTDDGLNLKTVRSITQQICWLLDREIEVIVVTSGAVASGVKKIGLPKRPEQIPERQAAAAVGQAGLIMEYEKAFARYNKKVAQILLTSEDLSNRKRYLNARNTLSTLLSWNVVPVINENDTIMVEEIKFGDNDHLSAMIALLLNADILINLTDTDGLFDKDTRVNPDEKILPFISGVNKDLEDIAGKSPGEVGTGGMQSKIKAARKVVTAGVPMVIANGKKNNILIELFSGKETGTFFVPKKEKLTSRKCWIGFSLTPKGSIFIDEGAAKAIVKLGKSLLPGGITGLEGDFSEGAPVAIKNADNDVLGIGLVNYGSTDIRKIMGLKTSMIKAKLGIKPYDEAIHRDNLTITGECEL